eukprot:GEMP01047278.1.p1 GENE.GEMP01047278.1~~GEMP01047278.1.p1  ORF type:complete len:287 (+),score=44.70 GEMP01047278.1:42-902(+)
MAGRFPGGLKTLLSQLSGGAAPIMTGLTVVGGGAYIFNNCLYDVQAGHRAIKFNRIWGLGDEIITEGTHVIIPWLEWPIIFDVRTRPRTIVSLTGSRDLQMVNISIRTLVRPDSGRLATIYRTLGTDFDEKVLPSIVNETVKSVVAQFNAAQLIQEREKVSSMIRRQLDGRAKDFNIILDDVAITHLSFSPEYEKAVESKQVAQQQSEKAKYLVLKAHEEKKKTVIKAEGEHEAARLIGQAISNNPGFVALRRIETAREISTTLAKSQNKIMLSSDSLMLNLEKFA